ncbi:hypothetical protein SDRG_09097 [Saprolegnia diclina VS20]|uniref:Uncharacterized protein n=1 Tax=Saprolegnia diclina (strain VS20) TaxID=1156394 RepID=T0Q5H8_SAPDV|nr:hypothetical protein SDRG_09097 [Saprolegnia diclina VS20]EQC33109.1 hypothetical protein SDRG_09097 [Saprolegnia diclina VS20]|eukprot:XP_008613232.1 hypothetical protein SDRG_09097 [Saprolegnia diclina VS20]
METAAKKYVALLAQAEPVLLDSAAQWTDDTKMQTLLRHKLLPGLQAGLQAKNTSLFALTRALCISASFVQALTTCDGLLMELTSQLSLPSVVSRPELAVCVAHVFYVVARAVNQSSSTEKRVRAALFSGLLTLWPMLNSTEKSVSGAVAPLQEATLALAIEALALAPTQEAQSALVTEMADAITSLQLVSPWSTCVEPNVCFYLYLLVLSPHLLSTKEAPALLASWLTGLDTEASNDVSAAGLVRPMQWPSSLPFAVNVQGKSFLETIGTAASRSELAAWPSLSHLWGLLLLPFVSDESWWSLAAMLCSYIACHDPPQLDDSVLLTTIANRFASTAPGKRPKRLGSVAKLVQAYNLASLVPATISLDALVLAALFQATSDAMTAANVALSVRDASALLCIVHLCCRGSPHMPVVTLFSNSSASLPASVLIGVCETLQLLVDPPAPYQTRVILSDDLAALAATTVRFLLGPPPSPASGLELWRLLLVLLHQPAYPWASTSNKSILDACLSALSLAHRDEQENTIYCVWARVLQNSKDMTSSHDVRNALQHLLEMLPHALGTAPASAIVARLAVAAHHAPSFPDMRILALSVVNAGMEWMLWSFAYPAAPPMVLFPFAASSTEPDDLEDARQSLYDKSLELATPLSRATSTELPACSPLKDATTYLLARGDVPTDVTAASAFVFHLLRAISLATIHDSSFSHVLLPLLRSLRLVCALPYVALRDPVFVVDLVHTLMLVAEGTRRFEAPTAMEEPVTAWHRCGRLFRLYASIFRRVEEGELPPSTDLVRMLCTALLPCVKALGLFKASGGRWKRDYNIVLQRLVRSLTWSLAAVTSEDVTALAALLLQLLTVIASKFIVQARVLFRSHVPQLVGLLGHADGSDRPSFVIDVLDLLRFTAMPTQAELTAAMRQPLKEATALLVPPMQHAISSAYLAYLESTLPI